MGRERRPLAFQVQISVVLGSHAQMLAGLTRRALTIRFMADVDPYLGLCHRRQWPQPQYESYATRAGVKCVVRVNNREYHTDTTYENEVLATENAAMRAYLICRNFSVNDGRYPSGHNKSGVLQGMPVAIGSERRSFYTEDAESTASSGSRSGGSSPRSYEAPKNHGSDRRGSGMGRVLAYSGGRRR